MNGQIQMPLLVALIIHDLELLQEVLDRWEEAGVSGATVLDCAGYRHLRDALGMDNVPLFPSLADLMREEAISQKLIFAIVSDESMTRRLLEVSQQVLNKSKGLLFTLPVGMVVGLGQTVTP